MVVFSSHRGPLPASPPLCRSPWLGHIPSLRVAPQKFCQRPAHLGPGRALVNPQIRGRRNVIGNPEARANTVVGVPFRLPGAVGNDLAGAVGAEGRGRSRQPPTDVLVLGGGRLEHCMGWCQE